MRANGPQKQFKRQPVSVLSARRSPSWRMKPWRVFSLLAVVCLIVGYGTVLLGERQAIRDVDRKFLDSVVQQESRDAEILSPASRNAGIAGTIASSHPSVLRAELVVNSSIVRRGEPVVHSLTVKRKRPNITAAN